MPTGIEIVGGVVVVCIVLGIVLIRYLGGRLEDKGKAETRADESEEREAEHAEEHEKLDEVEAKGRPRGRDLVRRLRDRQAKR